MGNKRKGRVSGKRVFFSSLFFPLCLSLSRLRSLSSRSPFACTQEDQKRRSKRSLCFEKSESHKGNKRGRPRRSNSHWLARFLSLVRSSSPPCLLFPSRSTPSPPAHPSPAFPTPKSLFSSAGDISSEAARGKQRAKKKLAVVQKSSRRKRGLFSILAVVKSSRRPCCFFPLLSSSSTFFFQKEFLWPRSAAPRPRPSSPTRGPSCTG